MPEKLQTVYHERMFKVPLPLLISRIALAACFLGFGIWEIVSPSLWTTYLPGWSSGIADPILLIVIHGIALTVAALGVLSGYFAKFFTGLSVLLLLEICIEIWFQEGFTETLIRDIGLLLFTCALFAEACMRKRA